MSFGIQSKAAAAQASQPRAVFAVQGFFRLAILAFAFLDTWFCRYYMGPDGVSYLDMGDYYWKGDWHNALSTYWSPLYAWMTALLFHATHPSMRWEFPEVHLLNLAILIAALICFEFFWRELLASECDLAAAAPGSAWAIGYLLFLYIHVRSERFSIVTPDLVVAALVYLAMAMMLRFKAGKIHATGAAVLGIVLGAGYLAKAAMLPFAILMIATMAAVALRHRRDKFLVAVTMLALLAVSVPYIAAISWNAHRLTIGDSGKFNVAWEVNGVKPKYRHWQPGAASSTLPEHTTRKLMNWPEVYEFAAPIAGTYPVWFDPTYWNAGVDTHMHPAQEAKIFSRNLLRFASLTHTGAGLPTIVVLAMLLLGGSINASWRKLLGFWPILAPSFAFFAMYAMVYWEGRYTSGVLLAVCGAITASATFANASRRTIATRAAILILCALGIWRAAVTLRDDLRASRIWAQPVAAAEQLRDMGLLPGDRVALIGDGFVAYWARLDRVRIVAELPRGDRDLANSAAAFWSATPAVERTVLDTLKSTGAVAVVSDAAPQILPPGWTAVGATGRAVYFFR